MVNKIFKNLNIKSKKTVASNIKGSGVGGRGPGAGASYSVECGEWSVEWIVAVRLFTKIEKP